MGVFFQGCAYKNNIADEQGVNSLSTFIILQIIQGVNSLSTWIILQIIQIYICI